MKKNKNTRTKKPVDVKIVEIPACDASHSQYAYAREKLGVAVWKLATGVDKIKARLADVYTEIAILQESDFPTELATMWKGIRADLTNGKMQYEEVIRDDRVVKSPIGLLYSTLRFMRIEKAQNIARRIYELDARLNCLFNQSADKRSTNDVSSRVGPAGVTFDRSFVLMGIIG